MKIPAKILCTVLTLSGWDIAFADDVHGVLRVVKGDVQIKSSSNGETTKAKLGGQVFPKDVIITGKDSRAKIVMIDNNEINVSPESQIELQHYEYDPNAGKKEVLLNVIYGKVRSKVEQKYDGKTTKFQIKTPAAVAGVRGTDFITSFNQSSHSSQVITFQGKVEFGLPGPNNTILNPVFVTPGNSSTSVAGRQPDPPTSVPKNELAKIEKESKADPAASGSKQDSGDQQRQPASSKGNSNSGSGNSAPTGAGPAGGGTMLKPEDQSSVKSGGELILPPVPVAPTPIPVLTPNPLQTCDFCNNLIQGGTNSKVTIIIKTQ